MAFPDALCSALKMPLAIDYRRFDIRKNKLDRGDYAGSCYRGVSRTPPRCVALDRRNREAFAPPCLRPWLSPQKRKRLGASDNRGPFRESFAISRHKRPFRSDRLPRYRPFRSNISGNLLTTACTSPRLGISLQPSRNRAPVSTTRRLYLRALGSSDRDRISATAFPRYAPAWECERFALFPFVWRGGWSSSNSRGGSGSLMLTP